MRRQPIIVPKQPECPYEKPFGYIYLITNPINYHRYVGKHVYSHPYKDESYWASGGEHLRKAIEKYGSKEFFEYSILEWVNSENHSKEQLGRYLADLEKYYISLFETFRSPTDYNETPGGDSWECGENNPMWGNHRFSGKNHPMYGVIGDDNPRTGMKHTDESKQKMRKSKPSLQGKNNPMYGVRRYGSDNPFYGKKHSEETKKRISKLNTGNKGLVGEQNPMYGIKYGKHPRSVSVVKLSLEGEFIQEYESFSLACEEGFNSSAISDCCTGKSKTHKGYRWMYLSEYEKLKGVI